MPIIGLVYRDREGRTSRLHQVGLVVCGSEGGSTDDGMHMRSDTIRRYDRIESLGNEDPNVGIPVGCFSGDRKKSETLIDDP